MAQTPLEQFCIEHSLILVGQLSRWREESPKTPFEEMLLRNHTIVPEENWLDEVAGLGLNIPIIPMPDSPRLPVAAVTAKANKLRAEHRGLILQSSPILVVGTFNPFTVDTLSDEVALAYPGEHKKIVLLSPHAYSQISALAERGTCTFDGEWGEDIGEWCTLLGQDETGYLDLGMVIEEIWCNAATPTPVILPGQITAGVTLPGLDAILVKKTPLYAWVVSHRPFSKELHNSVMQSLGLSAHFLAVGPNEFTRIKLAAERNSKTHVEVQRDGALHIRDWGLSGLDDIEISRRIVQSAIEMGASDIHIEPKTTKARVRFRIDNELFEQAPLPISTYIDVMKRFKIMGVMMQDKSGLLQDGAGVVEFNAVRYDLRFAVGVVNGGMESVVVRIFNSKIPDLADLRLKENEMKVLKWFLDQENGMVICSGPTGSGKTTLLYALLKALDSPDLDIVTIEQPCEKHFENAKQISVKEEGKLTYATALRSILRQDPDIIMIGEIRDDESAVKSVEAAMTGHLVLTTTHATSSVGVIERLCGSFPVDKVALGTVLKLSIAQRLVGRLCSFCKKVRNPRASDLEYFPPTEIARPIIAERVGCSACRGTGLAGRILVMEMMPVDDAIRQLIAEKAPPTVIEQYNRQRGFTSLIDQASYLLQTGEISIESARQFVTRPLI